MPVNERAQDHKVGRQGRGSQPPWEDLATIMRSTFVTLSDLRNEIGRGSLMCGREYVVSLGEIAAAHQRLSQSLGVASIHRRRHTHLS